MAGVYDAPMSRRIPLLIAVVATTAVVGVALLPKRSGGGSPAEIEPYLFANKLPEVHPPLEALRPELLADPVARTAARIEWGPPDVFYWSARHLPSDVDALARALLSRLEPVIVGSPLLAQRLIDALALLAAPAARRTLLTLAEAPPQNADFLQAAAVRALTKYPYDREIADALARLSIAPIETVKHAAMDAVVKNEVIGDPETVGGFLEVLDGAEAVPFLQLVVTRRLAECADACARHLESSFVRARQTAILALLTLDDARGFAAARAELERAEPDRVALGLSLWRDARKMPPLELARKHAASSDPTVRKQVAEALGPWSKGGGEDGGESGDEEGALQLLRRLSEDSDPYVQQTAVQQLWRHGKQEAVERWRETLRHGHGAALREAAQLLCETLKDGRAAPIVRERLAKEALDGPDQANLLGGLRHVGDERDLPDYVERILRAGTPQDVRGSERTFLSEYASLHVQTFGVAAALPLAQALPRAATTRAKLALLDGLRGVAKGTAGPAATSASDLVFALLLDGEAPLEVRLACIDTIAFFDDLSLGEKLLALRDRVGEKRLADRIVVVYASFF